MKIDKIEKFISKYDLQIQVAGWLGKIREKRREWLVWLVHFDDFIIIILFMTIVTIILSKLFNFFVTLQNQSKYIIPDKHIRWCVLRILVCTCWLLAINCFRKTLHLRYLTGFWMHLWNHLTKYVTYCFIQIWKIL